MIKQIVTFVLLSIVVSAGSYAAQISHNGYTLDTNTSIVSGGGLDWMQWTQTQGLSIGQATQAYSASGWRLATNAEMAALYNSFAFENGIPASYQFVDDENLHQEVSTINPTQSHSAFIELFGVTAPASGSDGPASAALYGSDADADWLYNAALVHSGFSSVIRYAGLSADNYTISESYAGMGVALVRPVPLPATAWLFLAGLVSLVTAKRTTRRAC